MCKVLVELYWSKISKYIYKDLQKYGLSFWQLFIKRKKREGMLKILRYRLKLFSYLRNLCHLIWKALENFYPLATRLIHILRRFYKTVYERLNTACNPICKIHGIDRFRSITIPFLLNVASEFLLVLKCPLKVTHMPSMWSLLDFFQSQIAIKF